ncbi:MAG: hypothetical protein EHM41_25260 [Chloroflexi bacterium]|nr:MAG: hypothetical protein EHM41_25260 [Chloroflexota bacterium]
MADNAPNAIHRLGGSRQPSTIPAIQTARHATAAIVRQITTAANAHPATAQIVGVLLASTTRLPELWIV